MSLLEALCHGLLRTLRSIQQALVRAALASGEDLPARETIVLSTRRHGITALTPGWSPVLGAIVFFWFTEKAPGWSPLHTILLIGEVFLVVRWLWIVAEWQRAVFTVTTRRVILEYGIFTRRRAMMPLAKVTDLTYMRSTLGDLFDYGHVIIESAGQDQALHDVKFLPRPNLIFHQIDSVVFGVVTAPSEE